MSSNENPGRAHGDPERPQAPKIEPSGLSEPNPTETTSVGSQAAPWYQAGLRFACTQCGRCCQNHGEYEYLYLTTADVEAMAAELELTPQAFRTRYTAASDGWTVLKVEGPRCTFLTEQGQCSVYEARPMQCRTWPFWHENLTKEAWQGPVQEICPGLNQGPLHTREDIERTADANEAWYASDGGYQPLPEA